MVTPIAVGDRVLLFKFWVGLISQDIQNTVGMMGTPRLTAKQQERVEMNRQAAIQRKASKSCTGQQAGGAGAGILEEEDRPSLTAQQQEVVEKKCQAAMKLKASKARAACGGQAAQPVDFVEESSAGQAVLTGLIASTSSCGGQAVQCAGQAAVCTGVDSSQNSSQKENVGGNVEKRLLEALERKAVAQLRTGTRGKLLVENAGFAASTPSVVRIQVLQLTASPARTGTRTHENTHNSDISLAHS